MLPAFNPELVPYGEHLPSIPFAIRSGRRLIAKHRCQAILVSLDPHAAGEVGLRLSRSTGLPLVLDFRDPWSLCELRRPLRPRPIRRFVDHLERRMVEHAAAIILNTDTALADYRRHYRDLPAERFHCIRNMNDPSLQENAAPPAPAAGHNLLFLGNFRRFVRGDELLRLLARLRVHTRRSAPIRLRIAGQFPADSASVARRLGVLDLVDVIPPVPSQHTLALMETADLLVILTNDSLQRLPAKFFEYCLSTRPMLALTDNPELARLVDDNHGRSFGTGELQAAADWVVALLDGHDKPARPRHNPFSADRAAGALAHILGTSARADELPRVGPRPVPPSSGRGA